METLGSTGHASYVVITALLRGWSRSSSERVVRHLMDNLARIHYGDNLSYTHPQPHDGPWLWLRSKANRCSLRIACSAVVSYVAQSALGRPTELLTGKDAVPPMRITALASNDLRIVGHLLSERP
jgi:hypothetical protein